MIAAVLRRSLLAPSRQASNAVHFHHLTPAAAIVSTELDLLADGPSGSCDVRSLSSRGVDKRFPIQVKKEFRESALLTSVTGSPGSSSVSRQSALTSSQNSFGITSRSAMVFPADIAVQGYATASKSIEKSKHTSENVKPLSRKEISKLSSIQKESEGRERASKIKGTKICIAIRSFDNPEKQSWGFPPHTRKVAMPDTRVLYTVLRSPHVDKKSREQFEMRCKKRFLIIKAQSHELNKKLFWLKRQRILGAQYEVQFHCKTRLDMTSCFQNIESSAK